MKKTLILFLIAIALSNCKKEKTNTVEKTTTTPTTTIPNNYIKKDNVYYEISKGEITAGLYDGGPKYYISIFLRDNNVTFVEDDDDVNAFSGVGTGAFIYILTIDSLASGNYTVNTGWSGFNKFDFNNPPNSIYALDSLPSNFRYLDNYQVSFTDSTSSNYQIEIKNSDFEVKYFGTLTWL